MSDLIKFGYAAGNYTNPCYTCHKEFVGDKRARTCLTCAQQMLIEKSGKAEGRGDRRAGGIRMNDTTEPTTYEFMGYHVPAHIMPGLRQYVNERIAPGGFLTAVIRNDLAAAYGAADNKCMKNLPAIVAYLYNEAPRACWGSQERMDKWLEGSE